MRSRYFIAAGTMLLTLLALMGLGWLDTPPLAAQVSHTPTPTWTPIPDDALTETIADFLVLRYDPVNKILYLEPIDPSVRIVIGNQANVSAQDPDVTPTAMPSPTPLSAPALRGKIIFKSTRDGGTYRGEYLYYLMNADGSNVLRLDTEQATDLLDEIQGLEGFSPDRTKVVMGDRRCGAYFDSTCRLYILTPADHANMIFSDDEPSQGEWFYQKAVKAKDPIWSPRGDYIVFASNHESPEGCRKQTNLFKGTPGQNPVIRRLTSYCGGGDTAHPSFSPDGSQVVYWTQFPGPDRDLYIVDVGADDTFDWRSTQPKRITFEGDNWDPVWIK